MNNLSALLEMSRQQQKMIGVYKGSDAIARMLTDYKVMKIYKMGWAERLSSMAWRSERHLANQDSLLRKMMPPVKMNLLHSVFSKQAALETKVISVSKLFSETLKRQSLFSAQHSISQMALKVAALAVLHDDDEEIAVVEEVQEATAAFVEAASKKHYVTLEALEAYGENVIGRLTAYIDRLIAENKGNAKKVRDWDLLRNQLISLAFTLFFWLTPSPTSQDNITKEDLSKMEAKMWDRVEKILQVDRFIKIVKKNCKLRKDPKFSSVGHIALKKGDSVQVINSDSAWANVKVVDNDGYPVIGWVPKKYLGSGR